MTDQYINWIDDDASFPTEIEVSEIQGLNSEGDLINACGLIFRNADKETLSFLIIPNDAIPMIVEDLLDYSFSTSELDPIDLSNRFHGFVSDLCDAYTNGEDDGL